MKKHGKLLLKYLLLFVMTVFVMGCFSVSAATKTGFVTQKGKTYYINKDGSKQKGWLELKGKKYYFDKKTGDAVKFPDQMQAIVDIVERELGILLDESSLHYERFMTHIKFLIQRIYRKELLSSEDRELSLMMQRKYPREYQCSVKVAEYIMQATGCRLSEEEIMYLSVHIRRVSTIDL